MLSLTIFLLIRESLRAYDIFAQIHVTPQVKPVPFRVQVKTQAKSGGTILSIQVAANPSFPALSAISVTVAVPKQPGDKLPPSKPAATWVTSERTGVVWTADALKPGGKLVFQLLVGGTGQQIGPIVAKC